MNIEDNIVEHIIEMETLQVDDNPVECVQKSTDVCPEELWELDD